MRTALALAACAAFVLGACGPEPQAAPTGRISDACADAFREANAAVAANTPPEEEPGHVGDDPSPQPGRGDPAPTSLAELYPVIEHCDSIAEWTAAYAEYPVPGLEGYDAVTALRELCQDPNRAPNARRPLCDEVDV